MTGPAPAATSPARHARDVQLTDGRVRLRAPVPSDVDALVESVSRSLPELEPWMPWATRDYDRAVGMKWITGELDAKAHSFVIVDTDGTFAGTCGLNGIDELNRSANLGYWLDSGRTGRGLATAATKLLAVHALRRLDLHRVEIVMAVDNVASRRVAERAGATYEGRLRNRLLLHGVHHDAHSFSLIPTDLP